jgi:hypothetical protein
MQSKIQLITSKSSTFGFGSKNGYILILLPGAPTLLQGVQLYASLKTHHMITSKRVPPQSLHHHACRLIPHTESAALNIEKLLSNISIIICNRIDYNYNIFSNCALEHTKVKLEGFTIYMNAKCFALHAFRLKYISFTRI